MRRCSSVPSELSSSVDLNECSRRKTRRGRETALVSFPSLRSQGGVVAFSIPLHTRIGSIKRTWRAFVGERTDVHDA